MLFYSQKTLAYAQTEMPFKTQSLLLYTIVDEYLL